MALIFCVLSVIPVLLHVRKSEDKFRETEIKRIAERRRERLDREHGVDRKQITQAYQELDQIYRVSEKEEL